MQSYPASAASRDLHGRRGTTSSAARYASGDRAARDSVKIVGRELDEIEERWLSGEPEALDLVHRRYRVRLEAVAQRILGNHADAEDVVQKIFIALRGASYRGESSLWTYLYRSAVNGAVNVLRAKRRRESAEKRLLESELINATLVPGPDNTVLEGEVMAAVARALLHVKPQHRRVLTLRIMHGLNNTEIAERENLPLPTVGTWLRRGREELRRGLRPLMKELRGGQQ